MSEQMWRVYSTMPESDNAGNITGARVVSTLFSTERGEVDRTVGETSYGTESDAYEVAQRWQRTYDSLRNSMAAAQGEA